MAKRVIAIGGEPATGKTTLMREIIKDLMPLNTFKYRLIRGLYDRKKNLYVIGIYDESLFSGTDKLSMAVQPQFLQLVKEVQNGTFIFEGDRLFNASLFYEINCEKIVLRADEHIKAQRHINRKDSQTESFKKSKDTKINNIINKFDVTLFDHNTENDKKIVKDYVLKLIEK